MNSTPKSTAILYPGGGYGRYLHWTLTTLMSDEPIVPPFNNNGNSHQFHENFVFFNDSGLEFNPKDKNASYQIASGHPKTTQNESLKSNITIALNHFDRVVLLYPDPNSVLLVINNSFTKIWESWFSVRLNDPVFADNLYANWPVLPGTPIENIPLWVQREILSYNLMPSWHDQIEWFLPDSFQHPRCKFVFVGDLLHHFKDCIAEIQSFCGLNFRKEISDLLLCHSLNLSLQKHLSQDAICNNIVSSVVNAEDTEWDMLPLPSQSWVQWQLRNLGYEIECNGLDIFPTNSVELQNLLYKV